MPTAADIARALKARRQSNGWMALCVGHKEKTPSLHISEGRDGVPLFHCFGGCPQAQILDALRKRGLWHDGTPIRSRVFDALKSKKKTMSSELTDKEKAAIENCTRAWEEAVPAEGTRGQLYLMGRGIVSTETPLPTCLRYIEHQDALIAAVMKADSDDLVGLHVVSLGDDEAGVSKKERRSYGPVRLGHIKISRPDTKMAITESLEDGLALAQMSRLSVLAVPGTSFLADHVVPPSTCKIVVLAPDADDAGRKAIEKATPRLHGLGFSVRVMLPPVDRDWADIIYETEERSAIIAEGEAHG